MYARTYTCNVEYLIGSRYKDGRAKPIIEIIYIFYHV